MRISNEDAVSGANGCVYRVHFRKSNGSLIEFGRFTMSKKDGRIYRSRYTLHALSIWNG